jgi:hypothetical protein
VLVPVPGDAILVGAKLAVTPAGNEFADNATCDWNPFHTVVDSWIEAEPPGARVALAALGVRVKLGGGKIVRLTGCVFVTPPPVAVTVRL